MKVDLSKVILDQAGKPVQRTVDENTMADLTLADVFINSLMAGLQEDINDSGTERLWKFKLAQNIEMCRDNKEFELKDGEFTKLKNRVLKCYLNPSIYAAVNDLENGTNT